MSIQYRKNDGNIKPYLKPISIELFVIICNTVEWVGLKKLNCYKHRKAGNDKKPIILDLTLAH
ncbi:hypothetical protein DRF67_02575 [Chryseobacterium pennipullorum]|uniref:Uncharacterized protein n=1 Tax=Chryseobacterium pennipullorum TaxID=2258963 RepID=A0A3D9B6X6_9FLAO|nr:hypothetical protein DRF67_02575 [Chryseobacterium pennipullorum]